jgi:hypothetical protein
VNTLVVEDVPLPRRLVRLSTPTFPLGFPLHPIFVAYESALALVVGLLVGIRAEDVVELAVDIGVGLDIEVGHLTVGMTVGIEVDLLDLVGVCLHFPQVRCSTFQSPL